MWLTLSYVLCIAFSCDAQFVGEDELSVEEKRKIEAWREAQELLTARDINQIHYRILTSWILFGDLEDKVQLAYMGVTRDTGERRGLKIGSLNVTHHRHIHGDFGDPVGWKLVQTSTMDELFHFWISTKKLPSSAGSMLIEKKTFFVNIDSIVDDKKPDEKLDVLGGATVQELIDQLKMAPEALANDDAETKSPRNDDRLGC